MANWSEDVINYLAAQWAQLQIGLALLCIPFNTYKNRPDSDEPEQTRK